MQSTPKLEKPRASADASIHAEYHRLAAQEIELFKLNKLFDRLPDHIQAIVTEKLSVHRRSVKYYAARARFTETPHVSPSYPNGVGLASTRGVGFHH